MKLNPNFSIQDKNRRLILPSKPNKELAEFWGILSGDGYMNLYKKHFRIIEISGDSRLDKEYLNNYVTSLIQKLFNLKPSISYKKGQNSMYLKIMSKGLFLYLDNLGFLKGKK